MIGKKKNNDSFQQNRKYCWLLFSNNNVNFANNGLKMIVKILKKYQNRRKIHISYYKVCRQGRKSMYSDRNNQYDILGQ